ncbi:MAG TPA: protein kinase, partial [Fimbriiglobus sp.]
MAETKETIGGYRLRSLLQTGQSSQVFEVIEPHSFRHFAMKILLPEHVNKPDKLRELFHEAAVGTKMRHENVINILKVNRDKQNPHFIMEFFPSGSLRTRLQSRDPKDKEFIKENARKIFRQVATGLAYMNANDFVHCDVKPDNLLV